MVVGVAQGRGIAAVGVIVRCSRCTPAAVFKSLQRILQGRAGGQSGCGKQGGISVARLIGRADTRLVLGEIGLSQCRFHRFEIAIQHRGELALIKILDAAIAQLLHRVGQIAEHDRWQRATPFAGRGEAIRQVSLCALGKLRQHRCRGGDFKCCVPVDGKSRARTLDRRGDQLGEGFGAKVIEGCVDATQIAGHGD